MAVNEDLSAYSTTAASNTPAGSSNIGPDLDNHLRDIKRNIRRVAERYQGTTTPEAFRGREWIDTSATASTKLEVKLNDGSNEVVITEIDTSAGTSTPVVHGTAIPKGSMAVQAASAVAITGGTIDGTPIGGTTPAAGDFTTVDATGAVSINGVTKVEPATTGTGVLEVRGYSGTGQISLIGTNGTKASQTATLLGDTIGIIRAFSHNGAITSQTAYILVAATENHSASAKGSSISLATTPNGSTTTTAALTLQQDQSATFKNGLRLQSGQTLLDQYDEGTFSVGVDDGAGNSATLSSSCVYTRIGNEVSFRISITLSSKGSMTSGNAVRITGMPFSAASTDDGGAVSYAESLSLGANIALTYRHSGSTLSLWKWDTSGGPTSFKVSNLTDSTVLSISGKYFV